LNDKLLKLKQKKLRQKVSYLRTELEETALIFQDAIVEFEIEFGEFFRKKPPTKDTHKRITTEPLEFNIPREDVNIIFRKIAQKTHPDKFAHTNIPKKILEEKIKLYKDAQNAVGNKDWARVIEIADELNIKFDDVKKDDTIYLEESIDGLTNKIEDLKSTYAWIWANTNEENKEESKKKILRSLGLSDK
jgi:hypothetical protein